MADTKKPQDSEQLPGYGQAPEGVRMDHPGLPNQKWGAQPKEEEAKERKMPDEQMPDHTPVEGP